MPNWKSLVLVFLLCSSGHAQSTGVTLVGADFKPLPRFMAMGSSSTEGAGNTPWGYRQYLQNALRDANLYYDYVGMFAHPTTSATHDVHHSGRSGDRVHDIAVRMQDELDSWFKNPVDGDVITVMIGTNNIYQAAPPYTTQIAEYRDDIIGVITAHDPNITVYVLKIQPYVSYQDNVNAFNSELATMVSTLANPKIRIVEIHDALTDTDNCPTSWAVSCTTDGLHPNATGHGVVADTLSAAIIANEL